MEWRVCPQFPSYEISERGDVRRIAKGGKSSRIGKVLTPRHHKDGYWRFALYEEGGRRDPLAHRLVVEAFIGPPPFARAEVCHYDGNPKNNHYSNLRWGTSADNQADKIRHGTARGRTRLRAS